MVYLEHPAYLEVDRRSRPFSLYKWKNFWYLEYGYLEYPAYLEVYLWSQTLILPRLSRNAVKFLVCLTYLASLRYQFTPAAIGTNYNMFYLRRSLILRCPRSVNELKSLGN
jgi:hypothetical protein